MAALDAERTVLGLMLCNPRAVKVAVELLDEKYFSSGFNRFLFTVIKELNQGDVEIDVLSAERCISDTVPVFMSTVIGSVTGSENIYDFCNILLKSGAERRVAAG
jgi:replicative DNA helicase